MPSGLELKLRLSADGRGFVAMIEGGEDALDNLRDSVKKTGAEAEKSEDALDDLRDSVKKCSPPTRG